MQRKQIRLKNYNYRQNGAYFITICTYNKKHLFGKIVDENFCAHPNQPHKIIEYWLYEIECKYHKCKIDTFVIMPNHIHFILSKQDEHTDTYLHDIIKWFKTQTTNAYIRGVRSQLYPAFDKHLWQRNYYEQVIRHEHQYQEIWQYIENNPIQWTRDEYYQSIHPK